MRPDNIFTVPEGFEPFMDYVDGFLALRQEFEPGNSLYLVRITEDEMHVLRRYGVFVQVTSDASRYQRGTARVHGDVDRALLRKWAKNGDPADYYKALLAVSAQAGAQFIDGVHIRSAYGIYVDIASEIFDTPIRRGYDAYKP